MFAKKPLKPLTQDQLRRALDQINSEVKIEHIEARDISTNHKMFLHKKLRQYPNNSVPDIKRRHSI